MNVVSVAQQKPQVDTAEAAQETPRYPYGTELHLDHDTLAAMEKANGKMPDVGSAVHVMAHGKVTAKGEEPDGTRHARVQLTHMGHAAAPDVEKAAKGMYPSAADTGE